MIQEMRCRRALALTLLICASCATDVALDWGNATNTPTPTPTPDTVGGFAWVAARPVLAAPGATFGNIEVTWRTRITGTADEFDILVDGITQLSAVTGTAATLSAVLGTSREIVVVLAGGTASAPVIVSPEARDRIRPFGRVPGVVLATAIGGDCLGRSLVAGDFDGNSGADLLAGAPFYDPDGGSEDGGAVFLLSRGTAPGPLAIATTPILPNTLTPDRHFGFSLASLGQEAGDGAADEALIGAPHESGTGSVWLRNAAGNPPAANLPGEQAGDGFGFAIDVGSLDKDGSPDFMIGAPRENQARGRSYFVQNDDNNGFQLPPEEFVPSSVFLGSQFATSIAILPDFTTSVSVVAFGSSFGFGRVWFTTAAIASPFFVSSDNSPTRGGSMNSLYGTVVENVGDLNAGGGDIGDLAIGAPGAGVMPTTGPYVEIIRAGYDGIDFATAASEIDRIAPPAGNDGSGFGRSILGADATFDGANDVFVGAPNWSQGFTNRGAIFLFEGSSEMNGNNAIWMWEGDAANTGLGMSLAVADFDGDSFPDLAAGAADCNGNDTFGQHDSVRVFYSPPAGGPTIRLAANLSGQPGVPVTPQLLLGNLGIGGIASCEWEWGDGNTDASDCSLPVEHAFGAAGDYTIELRVQTPYGLSANAVFTAAIRTP